MRPTRYGRFADFVTLTAALALPAAAQTPAQTTAQTTAPAPARTTAATPGVAPGKAPPETPPPTAPTVALPAGSKTGAVAVTATPAAPVKKPGEGVTMHGHWIVDLRNADGTIAEHRDFENSLLSPAYLFDIVTGQYVSGDLGITIASTGSYVCTSYGSGSPGPLGSCLIAASSTAGLGGFTCAGASTGFCNYTLKEVTNGGGGNGAITLSGTMPVLASGAVTEVGTQLFACNSGGAGTFSTVDPITCYTQSSSTSYFYGNLTGTGITALNVTTGQTLAFTVVLTFS